MSRTDPGMASKAVDHTTPLPPRGSFEAAPAYAAIRDGLGAYLAGIGYMRSYVASTPR